MQNLTYFLILLILFLAPFSNSTPPSVLVPVVYDSKIAFETTGEVKEYFSQNFEEIISATKKFDFEQSGIGGIDETFGNTLDKSFIFVEQTSKSLCFDKVCSNSPTKFIVYIPFSKGEITEVISSWPHYKAMVCRDPNEVQGIVEETGQSTCSKIEKTYPVMGIRFLVDKQGKISYAFNGTPIKENNLMGLLENEAILPIIIGIIILMVLAGFIFLKKKKTAAKAF